MRIVSLRAENVKRLRAVEITPEGDVVVIAGRNAQGKSSVLDAIWMALAGGSGAKETTRAIRDGEEKASVELDLGDMRVLRRWTKAGTTLEVRTAEGMKYPSPQAVLDGLIGRLSFDPLAFAEQSGRQQVETLLSVVDLPFDPDELAARRAAVFDARTDVNRETKRLEAQLAGIPPIPDGTPDEVVSPGDLAVELAEATESTHRRERLEREVEDAQAQVARAEEALAAATREHERANAALAERQAELEAAPDPTDPEPIRERLAAVEQTNEAVRAKQERARLAAARDESQATADRLTEELRGIDQAKAEAIAAAKMPLDGLGFDEEGVLYNGVPFSQASSAERLRVGIAMAMALNPTIRVIRITDGSLLDTENLALIAEMAGDHDFQVWVERVDETGEVGITIEDGAVA